MHERLLAILKCPACPRGELELSTHQDRGGEVFRGTLLCRECGAEYIVHEYIPILLCPGLRHDNESDSVAADIPSERGVAFKQTQIDFYARFPREGRPDPGRLWYGRGHSLRPARSPDDIHVFVLNRILEDIPFQLSGNTLVDVGCGGGRDAAILSALGATVYGVDISFANARLARRNASALGFNLEVVVGDAECLPLQPHACDVAFTHDTLHHLRQPTEGIREMARVVREGFFFCEPAESLVARTGRALGFSPKLDAGGFIAPRFRATELAEAFQRMGLSTFRVRRHFVNTSSTFRLGPQWTTLVRFTESEAALRLQDILLGKWGNIIVASVSTV